MNKEPIAILAAQKGEIQYLISLLQNKKEKSYGKYIAYEGEIEGYPVIILFTCVGIINAAVATTLLLNNKKVKCVINQGTAGAHKDYLNINDIVIGKECININTYKTKKIEYGIRPEEWEIINFLSGTKDKQIVYKADESLVQIADTIKNEYGTKLIGRLGSGDVWNQEKDRIKWISKVCNTLCEDMESVSIYKICNDMNIPVIGLRIISNNELKNLEFEKSTEINCQKFVYEMIKKIINQG